MGTELRRETIVSVDFINDTGLGWPTLPQVAKKRKTKRGESLTMNGFISWVISPPSLSKPKRESIMMDFDWTDRNEYSVGFWESKVVNTDSRAPVHTCFTRKELLRLRNAIDETLKAYDELGWDDSDVHKRNEFLEQEFWRKAKEERDKPKLKKKVSQDYLYLIHDTIQNTLKIGITRNPKNRFRNIQLATSNKLVMLYALKGKAHLEKELHKEFAEIRLASEWFKYDERIIERYKNL